MSVNYEAYKKIIAELKERNVQLVAVSKTKSVGDIRALYEEGQKDFGENYVQELADKQAQLPQDIHWHFIGHLQSNKVKYIASFVCLIESVDSLKLLIEINKQAVKHNRNINCLLQVHIAEEETKFGFDEKELDDLMNSDLSSLKNIRICGLMGMASFSGDVEKIRDEFKKLNTLFKKYLPKQTVNCQLQILSIGMSGDYKIAIEEGSTTVRIGSLIFGERNYHK